MESLNQLTTSMDVTVQSLVLKKGKPDIRTFNVQTAQLGKDRIFFFAQTKRDLTRLRFSLEKGCLFTDETGTYTCTDVCQAPGKSHYTLAVARREA